MIKNPASSRFKAVFLNQAVEVWTMLMLMIMVLMLLITMMLVSMMTMM